MFDWVPSWREHATAYVVLFVILGVIAWAAWHAFLAPCPPLRSDNARERDEHEDGGP